MFTWVAGGRASTCSEPVRKGVVFMSPYEELDVLKRLPDDLANICYAFETIKKNRINK